MLGRMMNVPLNLSYFLDRANTFFSASKVIDVGSGEVATYATLHRRVCRAANMLAALGVQPGDRVATLAWNHVRHLELYFAIPATGAVIHPLNLRLHPDDLLYTLQHADDSVVIVDRCLLPALTAILPRLSRVRRVVVLDAPASATAAGFLDYETCMADAADTYDFPTLDENAAAAVCHTSGTTGLPKGVVYSHRSTSLHTMMLCMADTLGHTNSDCLLPAVPFFHANAWGIPFATAAVGADLVLPGRHLAAEALLDAISDYGVTITAGVPTVWLGAMELVRQNPGRWNLESLRRVVVAGSAMPASLYRAFADIDVQAVQLWGMTELNPGGTMSWPKKNVLAAGESAAMAARCSQGYAVPLVQQRHVDEHGRILPWDGVSRGELQVRGPWVAASYLHDEDPERFTSDGWLKTGDIVSIDSEGYMSICDRVKDVIKSGGEWISSVALENALMAHPSVLEAAVFAAKHAHWVERPVAAIVMRPSAEATNEELNEHLCGLFARFWLPDDYVRVSEIPRASTGKFQKSKLRELYGDILLEDSAMPKPGGPPRSARRGTHEEPLPAR